MVCGNCGNTIMEDDKFCLVCGAKNEPAQQPYTANPGVPPVQPQPTQAPPQGVYVPLQAAVGSSPSLTEPLSIGQYVLMFILMGIPIVNLILIIIWGFGSGINANKKNYARAALIMMAVAIVLSIVLGGAIVAFFSSLVRSYSYY